VIAYPNFDPVIIQIGPLAVRWYGLMYLLGFLASYLLIRYQINEDSTLTPEEKAKERYHLENLVLVIVLGVILGGRLGYVLFYNFSYFLRHPHEIFATWHGGMSFHGGVIGAILGGWWYAKRSNLNFWKWADRIIVTVPIGLGLGRIGNFINGELYGRPTDVPWAMIFPDGGLVPRHPSQLYEALLEGVLLFIILWSIRKKRWPQGSKLAIFLILYGIFRFFIEFFREPDEQLGYLLLSWVTMGQILSAFMILIGIGLLIYLRKKSIKATNSLE